MLTRRYRLRTLMILIFAAALGLAAWHEVGRMDALDWRRMREGSILLASFLAVVAAKFGLIVFLRARRRPEETPEPPIDPLS